MNITKKGYYLDNSTLNMGEMEPIFKKCYKNCKTCIKYKEKTFGIEENHNCLECADYYYKLDNNLYPYNCYDNETINSWKFIEDSNINVIASSSLSFSSSISSDLRKPDYENESIEITRHNYPKIK